MISGALMSAFAPNFTGLLVGRLVLGLGIGGDYPASGPTAPRKPPHSGMRRSTPLGCCRSPCCSASRAPLVPLLLNGAGLRMVTLLAMGCFLAGAALTYFVREPGGLSLDEAGGEAALPLAEAAVEEPVRSH